MGLVQQLRETREGVVWIRDMLPRADVVALLSAATAFACPSIYEPLGIVNLEAMACETAVVATATGGIPEVVVDPHSGLGSSEGAQTGRLVPIDQATDGTGTPAGPGPLRRRLRRRPHRGRHRPGPGRRHGQGRPAARDRLVQLGGDRGADPRGLPVGTLTVTTARVVVLSSGTTSPGPRRGGRSTGNRSSSSGISRTRLLLTTTSVGRGRSTSSSTRPCRRWPPGSPSRVGPGPGRGRPRRQHLADQEPQPRRRVGARPEVRPRLQHQAAAVDARQPRRPAARLPRPHPARSVAHSRQPADQRRLRPVERRLDGDALAVVVRVVHVTPPEHLGS